MWQFLLHFEFIVNKSLKQEIKNSFYFNRLDFKDNKDNSYFYHFSIILKQRKANYETSEEKNLEKPKLQKTKP